MEDEMKKGYCTVKTKNGTEIHIGLSVSQLAICNVNLPTYKLSNDLNKVTCKKCKENWKELE